MNHQRSWRTFARHHLKMMSKTLHWLFNTQHIQPSEIMAYSQKGSPKRKETEKMEVKNWPKASRYRGILIPRKGIVRIDMSEACRQWLAEIDRAASIDELNHSGFAYSPSSMDFETNIVKGMAKIIPRHFRRKSICWMKKCTEHRIMLIGRQLMLLNAASF